MCPSVPPGSTAQAPPSIPALLKAHETPKGTQATGSEAMINQLKQELKLPADQSVSMAAESSPLSEDAPPLIRMAQDWVKEEEDDAVPVLHRMGRDSDDEMAYAPLPLPAVFGGIHSGERTPARPAQIAYDSEADVCLMGTQTLLQMGPSDAEADQADIPALMQMGQSLDEEEEDIAVLQRMGLPTDIDQEADIMLMRMGQSTDDEEEELPVLLRMGQSTDEAEEDMPLLLQMGQSMDDDTDESPPSSLLPMGRDDLEDSDDETGMAVDHLDPHAASTLTAATMSPPAPLLSDEVENSLSSVGLLPMGRVDNIQQTLLFPLLSRDQANAGLEPVPVVALEPLGGVLKKMGRRSQRVQGSGMYLTRLFSVYTSLSLQHH